MSLTKSPDANLATAERDRNPSPALIALLGGLGALAPLSIDASLPALPRIGRALHAPDAAMQATLGGFMAAFGLGQLILGPLSDRWGRRPVALLGLVIYIAAGLVCSLADGAAVLIAARAVQGFAACAGTVVARAAVRDLAADADRAAVLQSYVSAIFSVAPVVAPLLGALLLPLGWRAIYAAFTLAGLALLVVTWLALPETRRGGARHGLREAYLHFLRLPRSIPLALLIAAAFGGYFGFISGSPFVLQRQFHVPSGVYALTFSAATVFLLLGSVLASRLAARRGGEGLLRWGSIGIATIGLLSLLKDVFALHLTAPGFVCGMAAFAFCFGVASPNAFAAGLRDAGMVAGTGAAVLGAAQMLGGAVGSLAVGALPLPPSAAVGYVVACAGAVTAGAYWLSRRPPQQSTAGN